MGEEIKTSGLTASEQKAFQRALKVHIMPGNVCQDTELSETAKIDLRRLNPTVLMQLLPWANNKAIQKEIASIVAEVRTGLKAGTLKQHGAHVKEIKPAKNTVDKYINIKEKQPEWLIDGYIPKNQITVISGDGGSGKSSVVCDIIASVTAENRAFLKRSELMPTRWKLGEKSGDVLLLNAEDSAEYVLKRKLRKAGADLARVNTVSVTSEDFNELKFGSEILEDIVKEVKPRLCVFDPLQSFIPVDVNMNMRNEMRNSLQAVMRLCDKYQTTVIIVSHTNKAQKVSGRTRIADSADLWDVSRSVMIVGDTGDGFRYISHEKCNYGKLQNSIIFSINDEGLPEFNGYSTKRDKDYISAKNAQPVKASPAKTEAKNFILAYLKDKGELVKAAELKAAALEAEISAMTYQRAREELQEEQAIILFAVGGGKAAPTKYIKLSE